MVVMMVAKFVVQMRRYEVVEFRVEAESEDDALFVATMKATSGEVPDALVEMDIEWSEVVS